MYSVVIEILLSPTSTGEPTIHPEFCKFLETVYNLGIVPNYTTNGISIAKYDGNAEEILEATSKYVGGVAVSANTWNPEIDTRKKHLNIFLNKI